MYYRGIDCPIATVIVLWLPRACDKGPGYSPWGTCASCQVHGQSVVHLKQRWIHKNSTGSNYTCKQGLKLGENLLGQSWLQHKIIKRTIRWNFLGPKSLTKLLIVYQWNLAWLQTYKFKLKQPLIQLYPCNLVVRKMMESLGPHALVIIGALQYLGVLPPSKFNPCM